MLGLLFFLSSSKKTTVELSIVFTSSCPLTKDTEVLLDSGKENIAAARFGPTYARLSEGTHMIHIEHPWCKFYDATIIVDQNRKVKSVVNGTWTDATPIKIKAIRNKPEGALGLLASSSSFVSLAMMVGCFLCRRQMQSPKMAAKLQEIQENALKQREEMMKELERTRGEANR